MLWPRCNPQKNPATVFDGRSADQSPADIRLHQQ